MLELNLKSTYLAVTENYSTPSGKEKKKLPQLSKSSVLRGIWVAYLVEHQTLGFIEGRDLEVVEMSLCGAQ